MPLKNNDWLTCEAIVHRFCLGVIWGGVIFNRHEKHCYCIERVQEMYFRLCIMQPYLSLKLKQLTENNALQSDAQVSSQASSKLVFRIQCETGVQ